MESSPGNLNQFVSLVLVLVNTLGLSGTESSSTLDPLLNLVEVPSEDVQVYPISENFNDSTWHVQNPVIQNMCHHPQDLRGQEGELFADYQLEKVHVVMAPGEISPSTNTQRSGNYPLKFRCMFKSCEQDNADFISYKKLADQYLASHRNKLGFKSFRALPDSNFCRVDELTPNGIVQLITVGRNLHEAYFFRAFRNRYLPNANILDIHSITTSSAFQSLLAFLHGFLSEKQIVKTLIHKSSDNFCTSLTSSIENCYCHYLDELLPRIQRTIKRGYFIFKDGFMSIPELEKSLNIPKTVQLSAVELYNLLMPLVCNGGSRNYDCHKRTDHYMKFTEEGILSLINKTNGHFITLSKDPVFKAFSDSFFYPFIEAMLTNIYSNKWSDKRIHLYSGDLIFLLSLLTGLRASIKEYISPATRLVFELYRGQSKGFYVRILLNGKVITQMLSMCPPRTITKDGMCPLMAFADFLRQKKSGLPCYR